MRPDFDTTDEPGSSGYERARALDEGDYDDDRPTLTELLVELWEEVRRR